MWQLFLDTWFLAPFLAVAVGWLYAPRAEKALQDDIRAIKDYLKQCDEFSKD